MSKSNLFRRKLEIIDVPINALVEAATNTRKHSPAQIRKIADSMKAFGVTTAILRDADNVVIAGAGRLAALKLLGATMVPTILLADLTEAERRAYSIADNKLNELSSFDETKLALEYEYLLEDGELALETTAFDTVEIDRILGHDRSPGADTEIDLPGPDDDAVSRLGDMWHVGPHRVLCSDARERSSFERLMGDDRAAMTFTDPPYNVRIAGNVSGLGATVHREFAMASGEMSRAEFTFQFLRPVLRHIVDFSMKAAVVFACMDWRHARQLEEAAEGVFSKHLNTIVWVKANAGLGTFYRSQHELILVFATSAGRVRNNFGLGAKGRPRSNVWQYPGVNSFRRGRDKELKSHPTVKNLKMVCDAILDCSSPGDIILDPFLGSGTTAAAAAQTDRIARGIEIDPIFVDFIVTRLAELTGKPPRLDSGETFAEVALARGRPSAC